MQHRYSYVYSLFSIYYCKRHKVAKSSRVWQSGRVSEIADVVLVVDRERFPAHRNGLAARREYFRGLLLMMMMPFICSCSYRKYPIDIYQFGYLDLTSPPLLSYS